MYIRLNLHRLMIRLHHTQRSKQAKQPQTKPQRPQHEHHSPPSVGLIVMRVVLLFAFQAPSLFHSFAISKICLRLGSNTSSTSTSTSTSLPFSLTSSLASSSVSATTATTSKTRRTTTTTTTSSSSSSRRNMSTDLTDEMKGNNLVVDPFCFRQFAEHDASKSYGGTIFPLSVKEFETIVNGRYDESNLKDGYAPFCKHLFIANDFTNAKVNVLPLTKENEPLVRTEYASRNEKELPVLQRYIPLDLLGGEDKLPVAKYLDLILYSREQIQKESQSRGEEPIKETAPWGIVSIKAQDVDYELPMNPITQMRNALGKEHGGSGIPLTRDAYMESVKYWKDNVVIS